MLSKKFCAASPHNIFCPPPPPKLVPTASLFTYSFTFVIVNKRDIFPSERLDTFSVITKYVILH